MQPAQTTRAPFATNNTPLLVALQQPIVVPPLPAVKLADPLPPKQQQFTFNPTINITVNGDAKDPRKLADEVIMQIKPLLDQFKQQSGRAALYDRLG